jgi:RNA polymerase sigma-70 factor (ECF subfamily)
MTVPLAEQDRALWDAARLAEGRALLDRAMARRRPGPFQIKAAIAACHAPEGSDWPQIAALYAALWRHEPTPVVALHAVIARAEEAGAEVGLGLLEGLAEALVAYPPFHAARADLLRRAGRWGESRAAYDRAIALAEHPADARFLTMRRDSLPE